MLAFAGHCLLVCNVGDAHLKGAGFDCSVVPAILKPVTIAVDTKDPVGSGHQEDRKGRMPPISVPAV